MPAARGGQAFFSRMQGTAVSRVSFATQAGALQQFSQRTLGTTFNRSYTPGAGAGTQGFTRTSSGGGGWPQAQGYNAGPRSTQSNASGWHSFGQTNGTARGGFTAPQSSSGGSTGSSSGWHVFGQPHQSSEADRYRSGSGSYGSTYSAPQAPPRGSYGGSSGYTSGYGQPLRLTQPMVQQRGYGGYQNPNYGGSRNYSAPPASHYNYSAPRQTNSAPHSSAPKSSGGGSHGGGSHGGGGGHSKGGGGGHHR
jgi:hypothetical protein